MLRETRVNDRVFVFSRGGDSLSESFGANCTAILGASGVLLVDPLIAPAEAACVAEAVSAHTLLPIRFVVLTHHHTDHALGAGLFARRGVPVVAHRACGERMALEHPDLVAERRGRPELRVLFADAEPYDPSVTFDDRVTLDLGDLRVDVVHPGHGHTPGDALVWIPSQGVLVTGDLVSNGYHVNYEHADRARLASGLDHLRSLSPKFVVPGHGAVAGAAEIDRQAEYHGETERVVREGRAAGRSSEEIVNELVARFPDHVLSIVLSDTVASVS